MRSRGTVEPDEDALGDAAAFAGVGRHPARVKCALLGWTALRTRWPGAAARSPTDAGARRGARQHELPTTPADVADVEEALRDVVDPELGINVVDLGLVYGVTLDQNNQRDHRHDPDVGGLPAHRRHRGPDARRRSTASSTGFRINWVWMPPWGPDKITDDGREQLRALGFNV